MKKHDSIYIAGHKGLIGGAIHKALNNNNYKNIITIDRRELDLENQLLVENFFKKYNPQYVINAAGFVGGIELNKKKPGDFIRKNLLIQQNIFNSSIKNNAKKVLFFGSSCMYPNNLKRPIKEDDLLQGNIEETSIGYALSKIVGIYSCLLFNEQYKKNMFIPLIPNSIYGPNDNFDKGSSHVLSALIAKFHTAKTNNHSSVTLWGSGIPRREFIYVDDLAEVCLLILSGKIDIYSLPINIGVGHDVSIKELSKIISNIVGYSGKIIWDKTKPDGTMRKLLDSSKLHSHWKPKTTLEDGIVRTYDWYIQNNLNT